MIGYLQVDRGGDTASAELVVHPGHRRQHTGSMLLRTAERDARLPAVSGAPGQRGKPLRVWAHGDLPPARAFATAKGYDVARELLFLARPLSASVEPATAVPDGFRIRTFRPGTDDDAWVALNARAFADHPEQGRLTVDDLRDRMAEPWFDAAGFFLVEPTGGGAPVAYLWTKVEPGGPDGARDGEVYAVGVDPSAQGRGLGGALTSVAVEHLASVGADRAVLYVDGDNAAARATYDRAGFAVAARDVQYAPPAAGEPATTP
jgi:mycothiol synthase